MGVEIIEVFEGLQIRVHEFDSRSRLHFSAKILSILAPGLLVHSALICLSEIGHALSKSGQSENGRSQACLSST